MQITKEYFKIPENEPVIIKIPFPNSANSPHRLKQDLKIMEKSFEYHRIIDKTKNLFLKGIEYKKVVDKN